MAKGKRTPATITGVVFFLSALVVELLKLLVDDAWLLLVVVVVVVATQARGCGRLDAAAALRSNSDCDDLLMSMMDTRSPLGYDRWVGGWVEWQ